MVVNLRCFWLVIGTKFYVLALEGPNPSTADLAAKCMEHVEVQVRVSMVHPPDVREYGPPRKVQVRVLQRPLEESRCDATEAAYTPVT